MADLDTILARWDSGDGKPYKGRLIDWAAFEADPASIGCMCAQGQVLHLLAGWSPQKLRDTSQVKADKAVASQLSISVAHAILLRSVNDKVDGAPSIVLTHPEKILGEQAQIILRFWRHLDRMKAKDWQKVAAARDADWDVVWAADRAAAWDVASTTAGAVVGGVVWDVVWAVAKVAAGAADRAAAWDAAWDAAGDAGYACGEIQGAALMRERGQPFFFLPVFGFASPEEIPI